MTIAAEIPAGERFGPYIFWAVLIPLITAITRQQPTCQQPPRQTEFRADMRTLYAPGGPWRILAWPDTGHPPM